jgi:predicted DNA-binding transcriptional regulator YafY
MPHSPHTNSIDKKYNKSQKLLLILEALKRPNGAFKQELVSIIEDTTVTSTDFSESTERTLRRYLQDLDELDIPVQHKKDSTDSGHKEQRYWIEASYQRSSTQITLLEWISLRFGRSFFSFLDGTNFSDDLDNALENLSPIVAGKTVELVQDLEKKFFNIHESVKDHSKQSEIIDEIMTCLLRQNTADVFYAKIGSPFKKYTLHPYTLVTFRQGLYLFAYDVHAEQIKTFAVDRFQQFKRDKNSHFTIPIEYTPEDIIRDSFGIIKGPEIHNIKLLFTKNASPYIRERTWHPSQKIETAAESGRVILQLQVGLAHELISWISSFGPDVEVLEPLVLREQIKNMHIRALEQYN